MSKKEVTNVNSLHKSRTRCFRYIALFSSLLVMCSVSFMTEQKVIIINGMQNVHSQPRVATMPGSSDPSGDEWPMFHRGLNHTGATSTTPVENTGPIWKFKTAGAVYSSPAIVGGRIYIGSTDGKVYCLNSNTGELVWSYTTINSLPVYSSPAVADGRVYVGCMDNRTYCLDAQTGTLIWIFVTGYSMDYSSPAVSGGRTYIASNDMKIYCLNAINGSQVWNYTSDFLVESSPAIWDGRVYVGSMNYKTICLNASTGTLIWTFATGCGWTSPVASDDGRLFIAGGNNTLCCLNAITNKTFWSCSTYPFHTSTPCSTPTIANGRVFEASSTDNRIYCFDALNGSRFAWFMEASETFLSSPAISNDRLYSVCNDGNLYCYNDTNGKKLWNYSIGKASHASFMHSSPAIVNGCVYVGSDDGYIYCFPMILNGSSSDSTIIVIVIIICSSGAILVVGITIVTRKQRLHLKRS